MLRIKNQVCLTPFSQLTTFRKNRSIISKFLNIYETCNVLNVVYLQSEQPNKHANKQLEKYQ